MWTHTAFQFEVNQIIVCVFHDYPMVFEETEK